MSVVYFHGAPGSPLELNLAGNTGDQVVPLNRLVLPATTSDELVVALAEQITCLTQSGPLRLIGFSMGARWALAVARRLGAQVERIDLIAPLGPFSLGHYSRDLKGYPLLEIGRKWPSVLRFALAFQALLARWAPQKLLQFLLQDSRGEDRTLSMDPAFRDLILALFRHSLNSDGYWRELVFASEDWSPILRDVRAPVRIWHGSEDNWAASGMSEELVRHLPNASATWLPGLSHYSALKTVLPILLQQDASAIGQCGT